MSLQLFLLRHAEAEPKEFGTPDFDRPLTKKGIQQCFFLNTRLTELNIKCDYVVASPAMRAKTTAELVCESLTKTAIEYNESIYHADEYELLSLVRGFDKNHTSVFLVGHNPCISIVAENFISNFKSGLGTCEMAWIEFDVLDWSIISKTNAHLKKYFSIKP